MTRRRRIIVFLLAGLLILGGVWLWSATHPADTPERRVNMLLDNIRAREPHHWSVAWFYWLTGPRVAELPLDPEVKKRLLAMGPDAVPALAEAIRDPSAGVSAMAIDVLSVIGDEQAVPGLLRALADENAPAGARIFAAHMLGRFGSPETVRALAKALSCRDLAVREAALDSLNSVGTAEAVPALTAVLRIPMPTLQTKACQTLAGIGDVRAVPAPMGLLKAPESAVRVAAAVTLGDIGDPAAVPSLADALRDDSEDVQRCAALALADIGDPAATVALGAVPPRNFTINAMGRIGDRRATPVLLEALKQPPLSLAAAHALGRLRDPAAVPAMIECLKTAPAGQRLAIIYALGYIGDPRAAPVLREMPAGSEEAVAAQFALACMDCPTVVPILIKPQSEYSLRAVRMALSTSTRPVACEARGLLAMATQGRTLEDLLKYEGVVPAWGYWATFIGRPLDACPAEETADVMAMVDPEAGRAALLECRKSSNPLVRIWAARALRRLDRLTAAAVTASPGSS
jgi:HEAT repeat protein